jgi:hypothetical protein
MHSPLKKMVQLLIAILMIVLLYNIFSPTHQIDQIDPMIDSLNTDLLKQSINPDHYDGTNPELAAIQTPTFKIPSTSYDHEFNTNTNLIYTNDWKEGGDNATSDQVNVYSQSGYLYFVGGIQNPGGINATLEFDHDLVTLGLATIVINFSWSCYFNRTDTNSFARWEYSRNGGVWTSLDSINASASRTVSNSPSFEENSICLGTLIDGSTTSFRIRLNISFRNENAGTAYYSTVRVDYIRIGVFQSTINYDSQLDNIDQNIVVNQSIFANWSYARLRKNLADYNLYYNFNDPTITAADFLATTSGTFGDLSASLQFTMNKNNFNDNGSVYFAIRITSGPVYYWSNTYEISVADRIAPTFSGPYTYNDSATPNLNYSDSCLLKVPVQDIGGKNLSHANLYWYQNASGQVTNTTYHGMLTYYFPPQTNSTILSFEIPESAFNASVITQIRIYLYDKSYNLAVGDILQILAKDEVGPNIIVLSNNSVSNYIEYNQTVSFYCSFNEPFEAAGFGSTGKIEICWRTSFPTSPTNYNKRNTYLATNSFRFDYSLSFNIQTDQIQINYGQTLYVWINAIDNLGNINSTYQNPVEFIMTDSYAPRIYVPASALANVGYMEDKSFNFTVVEDSRGSLINYTDPNSVHCYYQLNTAIFNPGTAILLDPDFNQTTDVTGQLATTYLLSYTIPKSVYSYGNLIYVYIFANDSMQNQVNFTFMFQANDIYSPNVLLIPDYPFTNLTQARTNYDLQITVNCTDTAGGSGIQIVYLLLGNSSVNWTNTNPITNSTQGTNNLYKLLVDKENLQAGLWFYIIRAYDQDGNYYEISGNVTIIAQDVSPVYIFRQYNNSRRPFLNTGDINFLFQISSNCLMFVYLNGVKLNLIPFSGTEFTYQFANLTEGIYLIQVEFYKMWWNETLTVDMTAPNQINYNSISAKYENGKVSLTWIAPIGSESESITYYIYMSNLPDFNINLTNERIYIAETTEQSIIIDFVYSPGVWYFKIVPEDFARNLGPASESVMVEVPSTQTNLIYIIIAAGAIIGAAVLVVLIKKKKDSGKPLEDRIKEKAIKSDNAKSQIDKMWDDAGMTEGDSKPKTVQKEESVWQDLSADAWSAKIESRPSSSTPTGQPKNVAVFSANSASTAFGRGSEDPTSRFDAQMRDLYQNAQDFAEMGQDSMAVKSYDMLLRLAEKRNDVEMIDFIKKKMENLF